MKIAKLEPSARKKGCWLVFLEDGTLLRVSEQELVDFSLHAGKELDEDERKALEDAAQRTAHRTYALDLLAAAPLSTAQLIRRLEKRGCPHEEALSITQRLTELGYLNDALYAETLVRHYAAKGYGTYKIRDELYRRGVPKELWDTALETFDDPTEALDTLLAKKLRGADPNDPKVLKQAGAYLARRGYSWRDISAALRRYGGDLTEYEGE